MGETTEDQLGDFDPDYDPNTMRSRTPEVAAPSDIMFLDLFGRFVKSQETVASEMRRRNDIQEKFLELARENSKVVNRVGKGVARTLERNEAMCPTCDKIGKCDDWCHTKKYP